MEEIDIMMELVVVAFAVSSSFGQTHHITAAQNRRTVSNSRGRLRLWKHPRTLLGQRDLPSRFHAVSKITSPITLMARGNLSRMV